MDRISNQMWPYILFLILFSAFNFLVIKYGFADAAQRTYFIFPVAVILIFLFLPHKKLIKNDMWDRMKKFQKYIFGISFFASIIAFFCGYEGESFAYRLFFILAGEIGITLYIIMTAIFLDRIK